MRPFLILETLVLILETRDSNFSNPRRARDSDGDLILILPNSSYC